MEDLKTLGVHLARDDFGTGLLRGLPAAVPIDAIKIDQSYATELHRDAATTPIATAVTELAKVIGMTVTAEGVETTQQHDNVIGLGCEQARASTSPDR